MLLSPQKHASYSEDRHIPFSGFIRSSSQIVHDFIMNCNNRLFFVKGDVVAHLTSLTFAQHLHITTLREDLSEIILHTCPILFLSNNYLNVQLSIAISTLAKNVVKVVKVKMVIFIFGLCHLLTIYKYRIFIYSGGY